MWQGCRRFVNSLEQNDKDVFIAAGLMNEPPPLAVAYWWDSVCSFARMLNDLEKMKQAQVAEELTITHSANA